MKNFVRPDLKWLPLSAIISSICLLVIFSNSLHAQEITSMEKKFSSLSEGDKKTANELLFGNQGVFEVKNGEVFSSDDQLVKTVRLSSSSDFSALNNSQIDFSSVEALTLKVKANGAVSFDDSVLSKMTSLKYVFVVFDHYMPESEVKSKFSLNSTVGWVIIYSLPE